jgi:hypothetical protein
VLRHRQGDQFHHPVGGAIQAGDGLIILARVGAEIAGLAVVKESHQT